MIKPLRYNNAIIAFIEDNMEQFFNFESFIAIDLLKIFYIIGVVILPVVSWFFLFWTIKKYAALYRLYRGIKRNIFISIIIWIMSKIKFFKKYIDKSITWGSLSLSQRLKFILLFILLVFFSELIYRLLMEYLIAFMQMHNSLLLLQSK